MKAAFAYAVSGWRVYALLILPLALTFAALALRGFNLGFYGDVVAYQFHYAFDGALGAVNWLTAEHWQRHLLGGLSATLMHLLAPGHHELWYALTIGTHMALALLVFGCVDSLQAGNRRWLAFAAAMLFCFDSLQTPSTIAFATGFHSKHSLVFALLSLYAYLRFLRSSRRQLLWHSGSVVSFAIAIMMYEHTLLFFLLHPLIAFVESRSNGAGSRNPRWLWQALLDSLPHIFMVALYVYLLLALFGRGNSSLMLAPGYILEQIGDALRLLWSPAEILSRLHEATALSPFWLLAALAALAAIVALFFGFWLVKIEDDVDEPSPWTPGWIALLGCGIALLNLLNTAPTSWKFIWHERLLYAASLGSAMLLAGLLAMLAGRHRRIGGATFALVMAIIIAPGISSLFALQAEYLARDKTSSAVHKAIYAAIPRFADDSAPYLLLIPPPQVDLALSARDVSFPRIFALHYGIRDFRADAVLYESDGKAPTQFIHLLEEGIVSPLRPNEIIAYDRLAIVAYDHESGIAKALDHLPQAALDQGNLVNRADVNLATNWSLLPADLRPQP